MGVRAAGRFGSLRFCSDSERLQCLEEVFPQTGCIVTSVTVRAGPTAVSVCGCACVLGFLFVCLFFSGQPQVIVCIMTSVVAVCDVIICVAAVSDT